MKRAAFVPVFAIVLMALVAVPHAQNQPAAGTGTTPVVQTPEWQKLSTLVGQWSGFMEEGGQKLPTTADVRMTGDGSALMHVLSRDTPHEMVTMIHPDGKRILATHYCAAHNQPRMAMIKAPAANQIAFEFVDGTNIAPGDTHMVRLVITFIDADHHDEMWTAQRNGKDGPPAVFRFTRKK
jgi:hypothetical protein